MIINKDSAFYLKQSLCLVFMENYGLLCHSAVHNDTYILVTSLQRGNSVTLNRKFEIYIPNSCAVIINYLTILYIIDFCKKKWYYVYNYFSKYKEN